MTEGGITHVAFFYGTLMSPEVLYRVIYGTISPDPWQKERLSIQPALLYGYQRHRVKNADYPAIYPLMTTENQNAESQRVLGTIVKGLSDIDVMRLDIFEGDEYSRNVVRAHLLNNDAEASGHSPSSSNAILAETYVWKTEILSELESEEWDFEEFRREKLQYWAGPNVTREDYEAVDVAVASGEVRADGTGGRGANGDITKQLQDLGAGKTEEPLRSAV